MNKTSPEEGPIVSLAILTWVKLAESECRVKLLVKLVDLNLGFKEVEEYNLALNLKLKSKALKNKNGQDRKVIKEAMNLKLRDEKKLSHELTLEKNRLRKEIERLFGENTRKTRRIVKRLRQEATKTRVERQQKYEKKLKHLRDKYIEDDEVKLSRIPPGLEEFKEAKIFSKEEFESIDIQEYEVKIVGDIDLPANQKKALKLHPKFAILQRLDEDEMEYDMELGFAKLRYELSRESDEKLDEADEQEITEEEEEIMEEIEARSRQVFDPEMKTYDNRKKRVTDMKGNSRVTLPKPVKPADEANIEMRRDIYRKLFKNFKVKNCKENGDQKSNMTDEEEAGFR